MIRPDDLLDHARALLPSRRGRPKEVDLRRGTSAAYYAVFHHLTDEAARHLIGSAPQLDQNKIRRTWSHGELAAAADMIDERSNVLKRDPHAELPKPAQAWGPLVDMAAKDVALVEALRLFSELQGRRHLADYDHGASFDKLTLLSALRDATRSRELLAAASAASREALFTLITVRRSDFRER